MRVDAKIFFQILLFILTLHMKPANNFLAKIIVFDLCEYPIHYANREGCM